MLGTAGKWYSKGKKIHDLLMIIEMTEGKDRTAPGQRKNTDVMDGRQAGGMRRNEGRGRGRSEQRQQKSNGLSTTGSKQYMFNVGRQ